MLYVYGQERSQNKFERGVIRFLRSGIAVGRIFLVSVFYKSNASNRGLKQ